jgi:hypothetical protein
MYLGTIELLLLQYFDIKIGKDVDMVFDGCGM